jgi:hypothetical protein
MRRRQDGAIPDQRPRAGRRPALCHHGIAVRRHRAGDCALLQDAGHEQWFYYYLSGMIFLSLIIYATMRDTKHASAMHRHE